MMTLSQDIATKLTPIEVHAVGQRFDSRAAVLFVLRETDQGLSLLLTQRSDTLSQHAGEVAFPGGMWEEQDYQFPVDTALRESFEEVNLPVKSVDILGQLPAAWSRTGTEVTPVVAWLKHPVDLQASIEETQAIFWLPIDHMLNDPRVRTDIFLYRQQNFWVPAYHYQGYEIWGLTSSVIVNFLSQCLGHNISRDHSSPEKFW